MNTKIRKATRHLVRRALKPRAIAAGVSALVIGGVIRLAHDGVIVSAVNRPYEEPTVTEEVTTELPNGDILLPNSMDYPVVYTPLHEDCRWLPEQDHPTIIVVKDEESAFYEEDSELAVRHDEELNSQIASSSKKEELPADSREIEISEADRFLLERICLAEAGNDTWNAKVGVVNTVLNRVEQDPEQFGRDIEHVIYKEDQFSPVEGWDICFWDDNDQYRPICKSDITQEVKEAVQAALDGENPVGSRCYFYSDRWISSSERRAREKSATNFIQFGDTVFHDWPDE